MKALSTIRKELRAVRLLLAAGYWKDLQDKDALYGAQQALSWALGHDAESASKAFGQSVDSGSEKHTQSGGGA